MPVPWSGGYHVARMAKPTTDSAQRFMRRALRLAKRGQGRVEPNPMVGCVLVRDDRVLAEGYHRRFGGAHAEVEALDQCRSRGTDPAGCNVFVSLEPCTHHGKTPPCTDALIAARVSRVYVAIEDPSPHASGRVLAKLRGAGIDVRVGMCHAEARQLNEPFLRCVTTGRPWVITKWAQTLDGAIATSGGDSKWISNEQSRRLVHRLRGRVDAIVVGVGTVLADDPLLTARGVPARRRARRVVVDPRLRLSDDARVIQTMDESNPVTIAVHQDLLADRPERMEQLASRGVEFVGLPATSDEGRRLELEPLLKHLREARSATNVLAEGGSRLLGSLFQQGLVDQVIAFVAPKVLADADSLGPIGGAAKTLIRDAHSLELRSVRRVGDDVMVDYRF